MVSISEILAVEIAPRKQNGTETYSFGAKKLSISRVWCQLGAKYDGKVTDIMATYRNVIRPPTPA